MDSPEFTKFLTKWRYTIAQESKRWGGPQVVRELSRQPGYLDFIRGKPGQHRLPKLMLKGIFDEVEDYRAEKKIRQKDFRDTERFLAGIERRVERRSKMTATVQLKSMLHDVALGIEENRAAVKSRLGEDKKGAPLGEAWEQFWPRRPRSDTINRGIDLDTRLQFQCAKMFRIFLPAASVRTIARLIVLVYWVTELAIETTYGLSIVSEGRPISVRSVEEKLILKKFPGKTPEISLDEIPWVREARKRMAIRQRTQ